MAAGARFADRGGGSRYYCRKIEYALRFRQRFRATLKAVYHFLPRCTASRKAVPCGGKMRRASGDPIVISSNHGTRRLDRYVDHTLSEDDLQRLIDEHPAMLPIHELEAGFGMLVPICRELTLRAHGVLDNLLMTPDGDIVVVECKLWNNSEARRKVVAQALDYVSVLVDMAYEEFEAAILKARKGPEPSLHAIMPREQVLSEPEFVEAVESNLKRGRFLVIVVGEGIRTGTQRLSELLRSHAQAQFTFALVELSLYRLNDTDILVSPRTLARTEIMDRHIVVIDDKRAAVTSEQKTPLLPISAALADKTPGSISEQQFYERMAEMDPKLPEELRSLIVELEKIGVYPEFRAALNFKWDPPEGRSVNFGWVQRNGMLWSQSKLGDIPDDIGEAYIADLAKSVDGKVDLGTGAGGNYVSVKGRPLRITDLLGKFHLWKAAIAAVQEKELARLQG